jgi:hypothetical protein
MFNSNKKSCHKAFNDSENKNEINRLTINRIITREMAIYEAMTFKNGDIYVYIL